MTLVDGGCRALVNQFTHSLNTSTPDKVRIRAFDPSGRERIDRALSDEFARIHGMILGNEGISVKLINKSMHEVQVTDIAFKARRGFKHKVAALESVTTREPMRFPRVVNARETEVFDFDIDPDHFLEHKFRSIRIVTGDGKIHRFPIAPSFLTKLRRGISAIAVKLILIDALHEPL
ncbi:hypothetical protein ACVINZ_000206 [Mesorhizobium jarvisii]